MEKEWAAIPSPASRSKPMVLAGIITVALSVCILMIRDVIPFGCSNVYAVTDFQSQYYVFANLFRQVVASGRGFSYLWELGLGDNAWVWLCYYLFDPTNLLYLIVPESWLQGLMVFLMVLKTGLCSMTMCWYLQHRFIRNTYLAPVFGVAYGFSQYIVSYQANIMWLDLLILAPLVFYSLERLVYKGTGGWYTFLLGYSILTNYYMGFILCEVCVLYFIGLVLMESEGTVRFYVDRLLRFSVYSVLAGLLASIVWVPSLAAAGVYSLGDTFPALSSFRSPVQVFSMLRGLAVTDLQKDIPLYCGMGFVLLVPLYFVNTGIDRRKRIVTAGMMAFLLLSFCWKPLDFVFHGMHTTNGLLCRQAFFWVFLVLRMGYETLVQKMWLTKHNVLLCVKLASAWFVGCIVFLDQSETVQFSLLFSGVFLVLYSVCLIEMFSVSMSKKAALVVCVLVVAELGINGFFTAFACSSAKDVSYGYETELKEVGQYMEDDAGGSFYRAAFDFSLGRNAGLLSGVSNTGLFASTSNWRGKLIDGFFGGVYSSVLYLSDGMNEISNDLLSVRYIVVPKDRDLSFYDASPVFETENLRVYERADTVSFGCLMPEQSDCLSVQDAASDAFLGQNEYARSLVGRPVLIEEDAASDVSQVCFTVPDDGYYLLFLKRNDAGAISESKKPEMSADSRSWTQKLYLYYTGSYCGYLEKGNAVRVSFDGSADVLLYRFDTDVLREIHTITQENPFLLTDFSSSAFSGTIDIKAAGRLVLPVLYDPGWHVYVDGKPVSGQAYLDSLLSVSLTAGTHTVRCVYRVPGMETGLYFTGVGIVGFFLLWILKRYHRQLFARKKRGCCHNEWRIEKRGSRRT